MHIDKLPAACVQLCSGLDISANLRITEELVRRAAKEGARYVLTPENTTIIDEDKKRVRALAGTMKEDASVRALSEMAQRHEIFLHVGSLPLRPETPGEKRLVNRSILFGPDGHAIAWYDKIHLFDVELETESHKESDYIRPGEEAVIGAVHSVRIGFSICYDVRFPALYRTLARAGAHIFTIPAAFTVPTGEAHWHVLTRARAIENGAFVLAAAQGGEHESGRRTYGHSLIISPWGEILAEAGTEPDVLRADLNMEEVSKVRRQIPVLRHERAFRQPRTLKLVRN